MRKESDKKATSVLLPQDIADHIKENPYIRNLSEWVISRYTKEFMELEEETKKLDYHLKEAEKCKERIRNLKEGKISKAISEKAFIWIKEEGVKRAEKATVEGVLKFFNNHFKENLNLRQFKILLEEAKK